MADETLSVIQGDTKTFELTINDNLGSPFNLDSYNVRMTVKAEFEDPDKDALIGPKQANITNALNGVCQFYLSNEDTDVTTGNHRYDIQVDNGSDFVKTIKIGTFRIENDVTDTSY